MNSTGNEKDPALAEPGDVCPKCGVPRSGRPDCPRCGLVFDRWNPSAAQPEPDPVLDPAWQALLENFGEESRHEAFLQLAQSHQKLDRAAARYRMHLRTHPGNARAESALAGIRTMIALTPEARPRRKARQRSPYQWVWLILILALAVVAIYLITSYSGHRRSRGSRPTSDGPGREPVNLKQ